MASAREVEAHVGVCQHCAAELRQFREMRQAMSGADLGFAAPAALRSRIEAAICRAGCACAAPSRRSLLQGFAFGTALSAAAAASVVFMVAAFGPGSSRLLGDVVSAHLRSLQAEHLTDVRSTDQHAVKPWFSGKLAVAPPVIDLTAQGFTLLGGRLDTIDGKPVAAIVYRRGVHVINLFVASGRELRSHGGAGRGGARLQHPALERSGPALHRDQRYQRRRTAGLPHQVRSGLARRGLSFRPAW